MRKGRCPWFVKGAVRLVMILGVMQVVMRAVEESPIPLEKGTRWVYEARCQWTSAAGAESHSEVHNATFRWTAEVLESLKGPNARAAVVRGFPTEIVGMEPSRPEGYQVLVATTNAVCSLPARSLGDGVRIARDRISKPMASGEVQVLLKLPLRVDLRWSEFLAATQDPYAREDGRYCWKVEARRRQLLSIKGLSEKEWFSGFFVAYRTAPDHQLFQYTVGVGLTQLEYRHHGTIASADVRMVEFSPAPRKSRLGRP